ncbi:MAG: hypothetical protein L0Y38_02435 [Methylococcaceae bacterium]|nr:hypothetical protein [Methylococcaceae bacterium]MCI0668397.1 hypothetical protein [Methylococcaceae bacterium]MCI0732664.1 hypothetical protein [Methylococcaceae bacterium]
MNAGSRARIRIIVALDSVEPRDVALEIARQLQFAREREFLGLFIEDTHVLDHARSRLAKEVMLSGTERPLNRNTLERQMRAQSTQVRQRFEAAASQLGLRHTFRVARGEFLAELLEQAVDADALVLSLTKNAIRLHELVGTAMERLSTAALPLLLLAREGWFSGLSILALVADPKLEIQALQTAARFAKRSKSALKIILTGEALAERDSWLPKFSLDLHAEGVNLAAIIPMARLSGPAILQVARNHQARLLVVPSSLPLSHDLIVEISKKIASALMVIRSELEY